MPQSYPSKSESYVYDGIEVRKTGRTASRSTSRKKITLLEIKPANNELGSWAKWVKEEELYKIESDDVPSSDGY